LTGTVLRAASGTASVKLPDGSVVDIAMPGGAGYGPGSAVTVQWNAKEQPVIVGGRGAGAAGAARVVELNIAEGGMDGGGDESFNYTLKDSHVASPHLIAALLNKFFNGGGAYASLSPRMYVGLLTQLTSETNFAEVSLASASNYKRAAMYRGPGLFTVPAVGRAGKNLYSIGTDAAGTDNSFLSSGTGFITSGVSVQGWGVWDAQTGGNFWFGAKYAPVNGAIARTIQNGGKHTIPAGGLTLSFASGVISDREAQKYLKATLMQSVAAESYYYLGILSSLTGTTPPSSVFVNGKRARVSRNTTNFPLTISKKMTLVTTIGEAAAGDDKSFLTSGETANLTSSVSSPGIGLFDDAGQLSWAIPHLGGSALLANGIKPVIQAGQLVVQVS